MHKAHVEQGAALVDGYAPFCKHVFVPNYTGAPVSALPITDANRHLLQSGGQACACQRACAAVTYRIDCWL